MRIICLLLLFCSTPVQAQFATDRQRGSIPDVGPDTSGQLLRDLQEARTLLKRLPASPNRDRIELLITRSELQVKQLLSSMGVSKPKPLSNEDFNRLSISMRNQAFDKDRYNYLETNAVGRFFTCDQASTLLKHFSFDSDRIRGAVLLHPHLTDPENFQKVLDVFSFDGSKRTVIERLKQK